MHGSRQQSLRSFKLWYSSYMINCGCVFFFFLSNMSHRAKLFWPSDRLHCPLTFSPNKIQQWITVHRWSRSGSQNRDGCSFCDPAVKIQMKGIYKNVDMLNSINRSEQQGALSCILLPLRLHRVCPVLLAIVCGHNLRLKKRTLPPLHVYNKHVYILLQRWQ